MPDDQITTLWLGAFRYYCGRRTYAVSNFCAMLVRAWPVLPSTTRRLIQRDLEDEFARDDAAREMKDSNFRPLGDDCDRAQWGRVRALWTDGAAVA